MSLWRPKPDEHVGHNSTHMLYAITCAEFDRLVQRSEGLCDRCSRQMHKPVIDHDHLLGRWKVRGLVCNACNIILCKVDRCERDEDELTAKYVASPFHEGLPESIPGYRPAKGLWGDQPRASWDPNVGRAAPTELADASQAAEILECDVARVLDLANTGRLIGVERKTGWVFRKVVLRRLRHQFVKAET